MKTSTAELSPGLGTFLKRCLFSLALGGAAFASQPAWAVVPIPDQVFYGTIAIQNRAVTNNVAGTNVVIEARTSDGRLLASYRMGTSTNQGRLFYVLRIPMEDAPASSPDFADPGDTLTLLVKKVNTVQFTSNSVSLVSGVATRMDFGISVDTDNNGVPDAWEMAYFGTTGNNLNGDRDHDGVSDYAEYVAGTSPTDPNDVFRLSSTNRVDHQVQISFTAKLAQGPGYDGRTRYYSLETTTNAATPTWRAVTNYSRLQGNNQTVEYLTGITNADTPAFFRGRVWLEGP